jgi:hypothetical protein
MYCFSIRTLHALYPAARGWLLSLALLSGLLTACSDDDDAGPANDPNDSSQPTFNVSEPHAEDTLNAGNPIPLSVTIADSEGIAQAKYEIHWAGDGHTHEKTAGEFTEWFYQSDITNGQGETEVAIESTTDAIPSDVRSGPYHIELVATDINANQGEFIHLIFIQNPSNPMVELHAELHKKGAEAREEHGHDHDGHNHDGHDHGHDHGEEGHAHGEHAHAEEVKAALGDTLHLKGHAHQPGAAIEAVHVSATEEGSEQVVWDQEWPGSGQDEVVFETEIVLSASSWSAGEYHFAIEAKGQSEQTTVKEYHLMIE